MINNQTTTKIIWELFITVKYIILSITNNMGNSLASTISSKLYPLIQKNAFPVIDKNL